MKTFLRQYPTFKSYYKDCKSQFKLYYKGEFDAEYEKEIKEVRLKCRDHYFYLYEKLMPKTLTGRLQWQLEGYWTEEILKELNGQPNFLLSRVCRDEGWKGGSLPIPRFF